MEIGNCQEDSLKSITSTIPELSLIDYTKNNNAYTVNFEYSKKNDPREQIFKFAVDSNWIITQMQPNSANLESIFRTLTIEDNNNA